MLQDMERSKREEEEAKRKAEEEAEAARIAKEELDKKVYEVLPLVARPYASTTAEMSHTEVSRLSIRPSRQGVRAKFVRKRSEFGHRYTFSDKEVDGGGSEFRGRRAPEYSLVRMELDIALQDGPGAMSGSTAASTQTPWHRLVRVAGFLLVRVSGSHIRVWLRVTFLDQ
jgi:hypothetical protein